jgi:hypothetical protein
MLLLDPELSVSLAMDASTCAVGEHAVPFLTRLPDDCIH